MVDQISKDRLGQWAFESDSEIAGAINGLQRMRIGRYNKVSGKKNKNSKNFPSVFEGKVKIGKCTTKNRVERKIG